MQRSIRTQLFLWILIPLLLLSVLTTAVTYSKALDISETIYDEMLLNSTDSVHARTSIWDNKLNVSFSRIALSVFRHNEKDDFYFKITDADGKFLVGDQFPSMPTSANSGPVYQYGVINGARVRICITPFEPRMAPPNVPDQRNKHLILSYTAEYHPAVGQNTHLFVHVAETCRARTAVARQVLLTSLSLELLSVLGCAVAVGLGVARGLRPLRQIQAAIAKRTPWDLDELQIPHPPQELVGLIDTINRVLILLRKHIEEQATFVSNAAHELRTPLAGLKTYVDIGRRNAASARDSDLFTNLNDGVGRMSNLVNKLLALATAESSALPKKNERIDLNNVVVESLLSLRVKAESKKVKVEFDASPEPSMVVGDHQGLLELIDNLILNAIAFTPSGGQILVCTSVRDGNTLLIVEDSGPGIPESEREKVFQRFYRILGNGAEGSGLGLAIVRAIADSHLATVSINAAEGRTGCRIVVDFTKNRNLAGSVVAS